MVPCGKQLGNDNMYICSSSSSQSFSNSIFFLSVSGLGYGIISGLFAMVNVLADITGPGSLGLQGDPQNFLIVSGELYVTSLSCANFSVSLA